MHTTLNRSVRVLRALAAIAFAIAACAPSIAEADIIYRETFGRDQSNGGTGNIGAQNFDWGRWNAAGTVASTTSGVNGLDDGRPIDVANVNAGPYYLNATPGPFSRGWCFADGTIRVMVTTEYFFNPADYVPGSVVFSWYQGNAAVSQPWQVVVRVGGVWYASVQTFDNAAGILANTFGTQSELKNFTFDPAAANWLVLNFTGDFDTNTHTASASSAVSLGANPGASLSGPITAFGLYRNVTGSNGRIDSYTITATPNPVGIGKPVVWNGATNADWDLTTTNWISAGVFTNFGQGDIVTFDDSGSNTTINVTAAFSPSSVTVSNNSVAYVLDGSGGIAGIGGLLKGGTGSLTLLTANTYAGPTTISNGTVNVGNGGGSGTLGAGSVTNNGALIFNRTNNVTVTGGIAGTGSLTQNGTGALTLSGTSTYTGTTVVNAGTLVVNGRLNGGGLLTNAPGTVLAGSGTNSGPVAVSGSITPGTSAGTFTSGALTLETGATATFEVNTANTVGGGVNDLLQVNGNLNLNNNTVSIVLLSKPQLNVPYRLVNYTGTRLGSFNAAVIIVGTNRITAALDHDTLGQVNVIFSGSFANLRWDSPGDSSWNVATSTNWLNLGNSQPDVFVDFDSVLFDDTTGLQTLVDIGPDVVVRPAQIVIDSTNNPYFIGGNGTISGAGGVTKSGPASITLSGMHNYSGGLNVSNGIVKLASVSSGGRGGFTVGPAGTLVAGAAHTNAITLLGGAMGANVVNISGFSGNLTAGAGTTSTIYMTDPENPSVNSEMNFTGNLLGSGNLIIASGNNNNIVDTGVGFRLRGTGASSFSGTVVISNNVKGELQTTVTTPFTPGGTGKFVLVCGVYDGGGLATAPVTGGFSELNIRNNSTNHAFLGNNVELVGSGWANLNPLGSAPTNAVSTMGNLRIGGGQELGVIRNAGQPHVVAFQSVTLTGGTATFSPKTPGFGAATVTGSDLSLSNITQLATSGVFMSGLRTLFLTGTNGYTGNTTISNGVLSLIGSSSLSNSPIIELANGGTLSVTGRIGGSLILVNGQTLKGNGNVQGNVVAGAGSTVSPGDSVGTISMSGTVLLQGTVVMEIDKAGSTRDLIQNPVNLTYGGTLVISNLNDPFADGDAFALFSASTYGSAFSAIVPATPGPGLVWNTSTLTTDGTLRVAATPANLPQIQNIVRSGSDIIVSGTNGTAGNSYYVLASTNITLARSSWTPLQTNIFGPGGSFSFTNAITPGIPQRFYAIQLP